MTTQKRQEFQLESGMRVLSMLVVTVALFALAQRASADTTISYNAATGTLPQAVGWIFTEQNNPPSTVSVAGDILTFGSSVSNRAFWDISYPHGPGVSSDSGLYMRIVARIASESHTVSNRGVNLLEVIEDTGTVVTEITVYGWEDKILLVDGATILASYNMNTTEGFHEYLINLKGNQCQVYVDGIIRMSGAVRQESSSGAEVLFAKIGDGSGASGAVLEIKEIETGTGTIAGFEIVDIGTLGGATSSATGINASGMVSGFSNTGSAARHAFVWSEDSGIVDLLTLGGTASEGWGINDAGEVVGESSTASGLTHAFRWDGATMHDVDPRGGASSTASSGAWGINNQGNIVGWSEVAASSGAFMRSADGSVFLGPGSSELYDLSNADPNHGARSVGFWPGPVPNTRVPAIYDVDVNSVFKLPGLGGSLTRARGINQNGMVVGFGQLAGNTVTRPFYGDTSGATFVLTPPAGFVNGRLNDVNDDGLAVGDVSDASNGNLTAVLWSSGTGIVDVNTLLDTDTAADWEIVSLRDVNNAGWMVGTARFAGSDRAVLIRPVQPDDNGEDITPLFIGTPLELQALRNTYTDFRIDVEAPVPANLVVHLTPLVGDGSWSLVGRFGDRPTLSQLDWAGETPGPDGAIDLLIPTPVVGSYFVSTYYSSASDAPGQFRIEAEAVDRYTPSSGAWTGGNTGDITVRLPGLGLTNGVRVELRASDGTILGSFIPTQVDSTGMTVTFHLTGLTPGTYDTVIIWPDGGEIVLPQSFTVEVGQGPRLEARVEVQDQARIGRPCTAWITYTNAGDIDMPAPLLTLSSTPDLPKRLFKGQAFRKGSFQVLAVDSAGEPGVLRAGTTNRIPIYYVAALGEMEWKLDTIESSDEPVDWEALGTATKPDDVAADTWDAFWGSFSVAVGDSWADYLATLRRDASYLAELGQPSYAVEDLIGLEMADASDSNGALQVLDAGLDAVAPGSGMPLVFGRQYTRSVPQRYALGILGRGWTTNLDHRLRFPESGHAIVTAPGGSKREFLRNVVGLDTQRWSGMEGETGQFSSNASGYSLREKDGTTFTFDSVGRIEAIKDLNGNGVSMTYTAGKPTLLEHTSGDVFTLDYNANGRLASLRDHAGRETEYTYDGSGEYLARVSAPGGVVTEYAYTTTGAGALRSLESVTFPDGTHAYYGYDARSRLNEVSADGGAESIRFAYDETGRQRVIDAFEFETHVSYGRSARPLESRGPTGQGFHLTYDRALNLPQVVDQSGRVYGADYNLSGDPIRISDPLDREVTLSYGAVTALPTRIEDPNGSPLNYVYDSRGNLQRFISPDNTHAEFVTDEAGNLTDATNRRGDTIKYEYNSRGQVARKTFPDGSENVYVYDEVGLLISATDESGTIVLEYDARNYLIGVEYPAGEWFTYAYNDAGQLLAQSGSDGLTINYAYDVVGRLIQVDDGLGGLLVQYSYDANGRLIREERGNGTLTDYIYDPSGRITNIVHNGADGSLQARFGYTYDDSGRPVSVASLEGFTNYQYDDGGQLVGASYPDGTTETFAYDAAGNRTVTSKNGVQTAYTTNLMNQYSEAGSASFTYDADGNTVTRTDESGTTRYAYDSEGRLVGVQAPGNEIWEYFYDALGSRSAVVHNGVVTRWLSNPGAFGTVQAEYDEAGKLRARYISGLGLAAQVNGQGSISYFGFDSLGHTRLITDALGAKVNYYTYSVYGEMLSAHETIANPFKYVGRYGVMEDRNTLYYMRMRYYEADLGRFLSEDPIGVSGGVNLYAYVSNKPTLYVDPQGTLPVEQTGDAIFAVGSVLTAVGIGGAIIVGAPVLLPASVVTGAGVLVMGLGAAVGAHVAAHKDALAIDESGRHTINIDKYNEKINFAGAALEATNSVGLPSTATWAAQSAGTVVGNAISTSTQTPKQALNKRSNRGVGALDPNEKVATPGVGEQHLVPADQLLTYTVYFENQPTATAPAQEVFVTDELSDSLDWTTFRLTEIVWADHNVEIPENTAAFNSRETIHDYREDVTKQWWVDVNVDIDATNGMAAWTFRTLDPDTGELPEDALAGFLPPNDAALRGEGHVTFTIKPIAGVEPGTVIRNKSSIVFDTNAPIITNEVFNTIHVFETVAPTVTLSSPAASLTNLNSIPVTVAFSEPVMGFKASDISTNNSTVSNFVGSGADYTFDLVPAGQGAVQASIPEEVAQDEAGNSNEASETLTRTYDSVAPTAQMSSSAANPTTTGPIPVRIDFSEAVTGFEGSDVVPVNAVVSNFTEIEPGVAYTFALAPLAAGNVAASVPASAVSDLAGNTNLASANLSRQYAPPKFPVVKSITLGGANPTNSLVVKYTVLFDEQVSGVDASDFAIVSTGGVSGASISLVSGSGTSRQVYVKTGTGNGTLKLNLVDNDTIRNSKGSSLGGRGVGNGNVAGPSYTIQGR